MDAEHVGDLATPVYATRTRHTGTMAAAQTSDELAAQFATRLGVDRGVDCFVGHVARGVVGEYALEGTADLLWRPTPVKKSENTQPGKTGRCPELSCRFESVVMRIMLFS